MTDTLSRTLHYGSQTFDVAEEHWRDLANDYSERVRDGGGWVDVLTVRHGVVTLWASPGVPVHFTAAREQERRAGVVY